MSSVANRKFTDMKQIEFQQSGSSEINAMLTQPLLENSSTYMCEVTDLQCTIGRELAFPRNEWLFSVIRRPIDPNSLYTANLFSKDLKDFVKAQETGSRPHEGIFGIWEHSNAHGIQWKYNHWINEEFGDANFGQDQAIPDHLLAQYDVYSAEYYSAMDLVYDVSQEVKVIDKNIKFEQNRELANNDPNKDNTKGDDPANWDDEFYHIGMACDGGGRVVFKLSQYFRRNYMIVTSHIFQQATGYNLFIGASMRLDFPMIQI